MLQGRVGGGSKQNGNALFETLVLNRNGGVVDLRERRGAGRDLGEERVKDYSQDVLYERRMNYIYIYI